MIFRLVNKKQNIYAVALAQKEARTSYYCFDLFPISAVIQDENELSWKLNIALIVCYIM